MKKTLIVIFLLCMSTFFAYSQQVQNGADIHITIENIEKAKGNMMVAVYNSEATFLEERYREEVVPVQQEGKLHFTIKNVPSGTYAMSFYHDENANQEMDSNFLGMPKEPVAFSNNAKGTFGPASFEDASFVVGNEDVRQFIKLTSL
jgi:uncharacterized protein (DUF2141 family)